MLQHSHPHSFQMASPSVGSLQKKYGRKWVIGFCDIVYYKTVCTGAYLLNEGVLQYINLCKLDVSLLCKGKQL